jgi:hypothetical protein
MPLSMPSGIPAFDRFVACDWSGARGPRYRGVAVAECGPGDAPPRLVPPPEPGPWTRTAAARWLRETAAGGRTVLAGFDFAFSLPFARAGRYFADPRAATMADLWDVVEAASAGVPDFLGSPFAEHPAYAPDFWRAGPRPPAWAAPRRATELACAQEGGGHPQSPYHLIGSRQVGKGALAGMRVLRHLKRSAPGRVRVWPAEEPAEGALTCVEIYPRLFLRACGFGNAKIRDGGSLDRCLGLLGSLPAGLPAVDDHEADALVSAAGLRRIAGLAAAWRPAGLEPADRARDGWIFGVGAGFAERKRAS